MATSTPINTKRVIGRRQLHFDSFDEVITDAEHIVSTPTRTIGNWSVGQIFRHIALSADKLVEGDPFGAPQPIQWFIRVFMKKRMLSQTVSPGFKLPKVSANLIPVRTTTAEGLVLLRKSFAMLESNQRRADKHPAFGKCTPDDWNQWHLRHCELQRSFVLPDSKAGA